LKGQRRNGGMFPVEIAVSESFMDGDLQYTGILRDVSERKRNEAELRWRAGLLEQAHEAVIVRRPEAGIVYWNRGAVELYGWTFAEAFGRTPAELFLTDASLCEEQLKTTGQWQGEVQHRTKAGAIVTVESRQVMVKEEDGLFIMETNRDVTDRRLAHERVLRLAAELEHRVRERTQELVRSQELLRRLASELTIAEQRERRRIATDLHDYLAQLLVCIRLKVSQARTHQLPSEAAAWLGEAEDVLQQALDYTRSLVAQLAPMVLHEFGLPTALKWLVQQMKGQQLIVSLDMAEEESIALPEDQAILLFQSVRELLINVVKHAKADKAAVHVRVESENLRITVQDEGRGFDPTESATLSDNGELAAQSNLAKFGLFSIRERMKALGGQLEFRSQPGLGTTAILILPLTDRRNTADGISDIPLSETSHVELPIGLSDQKSAMIRVLLVDDHAMMRQGLRGILEGDRDITVVGEAGDGIEAVAVAAALRPDVVIMDINMPKMDGVEATKRIKARFPSMVVIGLSMHNSGHHMEAMREAGAFTYLSKESVAEQLKKTILHCHPRAERLDGQDLTSQTAPLTKETATSPPLPHHTL
ncbi:MAG TPA: response regulator, partial [Nitrospira sp.]